MAWRETRAAWRHFLYFFVCITLGVGALVGVGTFASNVERTVTREARSLMGGDLEVRLTRPISEHGKSFLATLGARGIETTHVSELIAMGSQAERAPDRGGGTIARPTQIVELKAVEAGYPFYGVVKTTSDRSLRDLLTSPTETCHSLQDLLPQTLSREGREGKERIFCHGAIVQESLLIKMGLSVGDHLKIGQATFTITAVVRQEPDRAASAFSLGPRVMISQEGLAAADLIKPGSRVRERYLLRLPPAVPPQPVLVELRGQLAADSARVSSYREAQPQLRRFLDQLTRYLGLVGLTALFVGGIGVASTVHAFLKDKLKTIAILKTLGADSGTVVRTYLVQALGLGLLGSLAGAVLGLSLQGLIPRTPGRLRSPRSARSHHQPHGISHTSGDQGPRARQCHNALVYLVALASGSEKFAPPWSFEKTSRRWSFPKRQAGGAMCGPNWPPTPCAGSPLWPSCSDWQASPSGRPDR